MCRFGIGSEASLACRGGESLSGVGFEAPVLKLIAVYGAVQDGVGFTVERLRDVGCICATDLGLGFRIERLQLHRCLLRGSRNLARRKMDTPPGYAPPENTIDLL